MSTLPSHLRRPATCQKDPLKHPRWILNAQDVGLLVLIHRVILHRDTAETNEALAGDRVEQ